MRVEKISDYELMKAISDGDEWSKVHLWHRYQPMVHKRANYLMRIVAPFWEKDDLIQEFFLSYLKAIDYIDISKIPDDTFHFSTLYFFFLRKTEHKIKKKYFNMLRWERDSFEKTFFPENENSDMIKSPEAIKLINNHPEAHYYSESHLILDRLALPKFKKRLPEEQQSILEDMLGSMKIVDIAEKRKMPYAKIYKEVTEIRNKAKKYLV